MTEFEWSFAVEISSGGPLIIYTSPELKADFRFANIDNEPKICSILVSMDIDSMRTFISEKMNAVAADALSGSTSGCEMVEL